MCYYCTSAIFCAFLTKFYLQPFVIITSFQTFSLTDALKAFDDCQFWGHTTHPERPPLRRDSETHMSVGRWPDQNVFVLERGPCYLCALFQKCLLTSKWLEDFRKQFCVRLRERHDGYKVRKISCGYIVAKELSEELASKTIWNHWNMKWLHFWFHTWFHKWAVRTKKLLSGWMTRQWVVHERNLWRRFCSLGHFLGLS